MHRLKYISSILLALFVLSGSIGIDVYRSTCNMRGESRTFFTPGNDLCEILVASQSQSCCVAKSASCASTDEDGCCNEDEFTFIIEPEFTETVTPFSFHTSLYYAAVILPQQSCISHADRLHYQEKFNKPPPPEPYGRGLLSRIAGLRI